MRAVDAWNQANSGGLRQIGGVRRVPPPTCLASNPTALMPHPPLPANAHRTSGDQVSIRRTRLRIVLVLVAAENDDEDGPEAALPRVYSYNVTTP